MPVLLASETFRSLTLPAVGSSPPLSKPRLSAILTIVADGYVVSSQTRVVRSAYFAEIDPTSDVIAFITKRTKRLPDKRFQAEVFLNF